MRARLVWILVVVGLVTVGWSSGASGASFVWVWRVAGDLDPGASVELACPSAGLCVAVDGGGQVMRSTAPAVGVGSWSTTQVAGAPSFTALACAADSACVGGDSAGRIWTFDDPAAGVGSPAAVELEPGTRIAGVACPSASVCVAVAGEDVLVSNNPAAGGGSWQVFKNVDGYGDYECVKYQEDDCSVPLTGVSCASSSYCVAIDGEGGTVGVDPMTGTFTDAQGIDASLILDGAACLPGGPCMTECAQGEGAGSDSCPGDTYAATDLCGATSGCYQLSSGELYGFSCPARSLCYTGGPSGNLLVSTNPAGGASAWRTVLRASSIAPRPIQEIACPTADLCVATDSRGELLLGARPPSGAGLRRLLIGQITIPRRAATISSLLRHDGFRYSVSSPTAARLRIRWTRPQANHRTVLATGTTTFRASGTDRVAVRLTRAGRKFLRAAPQRSIVVATADLVGTVPRSVHVSRRVAITRQQ